VGRIGLREFVCPSPPDLPAQVLPRVRDIYAADRDLEMAADVVDARPARAVTLHARGAGSPAFQSWPMTRQRGYRYAASIPAGTFSAGPVEYYFSADAEGGTVRSPGEADRFWTSRIVASGEPLLLFEANRDTPRLAYTRIGDDIRHGIFKYLPATDRDPAALRLSLPLSYDRTLDDYTASLAVKDRIFDRRAHIGAADSLSVRARGVANAQPLWVTLVEADGTSWSVQLDLTPDWQDFVVPLRDLKVALGVKLPQGFPERWSYWLTPAKGRGSPDDRLNPAAIEHVQVSLRPERGRTQSKDGGADAWVDIASVALAF